ncbi:MAG TPA: PAS domain S-box protein [Myxococcota bacterium]|nr:PAS domain S-box protein [Myxococcota bacterium]HRY95004.1 PAS domain S-box protein [Myxococcota bacterium]
MPPREPSPDDLRALVEHAMTGVFVLANDRIAYANRAFEELVGYGREELAGLDAWAIVHPEDREAVRARGQARLARQREGEVYETRMLHRDGRVLWVEVRATAITFDGQPAAIVHMQDITERHRAEAALADSEARLRGFLDHAPVGIYHMTPAGRLGLANPALRRMLGYGNLVWPPGGLERESFDPAYPQSELRRRLEREGEARGLESAWIRRDNALLYVRESARCVRGAADELLYIEGTVLDVTGEKQAFQTLQLFSQRLAARHELDSAILSSRSTTTLAGEVVTRLQRLMRSQRTSVILVDRGRGVGRVVAVAVEPGFRGGPGPGEEIPLARLSSPEELAELPFVYLTDLTQAQGLAPLQAELGACGVRSLLTVPLRVEEQLVGQLNIAATRPAAFDSEAKRTALELAHQLAVALDQARLREALEAERTSLRAVLDNLPAGVIWLGGDGRVEVANRHAQQILELPGAPAAGALAELAAGASAPVELQLAGPPLRLFEVVARPVAPPGSPSGQLLLLREVTSERTLQRQVRQQERLAAIGELARGVAHDFNNLLTAIQGLGAVVRRRLEDGHPAAPALEEIEQTCGRGSALARQLMAFGRQQTLEPQPLLLDEVVEGMARMLRRLLGADIRLELRLAAPADRVEVDPAQLEQVVLNLVLNARDAMPRGGTVVLETEPVDIDATDVAHLMWAVPLGSFVRLSVLDDGEGMSEGTQAHAFEPFFTTKAERGGTGLGLSTVYGIVKQSGGEVRLTSTPGVGTRFDILLPRLPG